MDKELSFIDIIKIMLGDQNYTRLLIDISKEMENKKVDLHDFYEIIVNKHCFIIFMLGVSKRMEIPKYKFQTNNNSVEIKSNEFRKKYSKYAKIIRNKRFEIMEKVI